MLEREGVCRSCNAKLVFLRNPETGSWIPCQRVRTIYRQAPGGSQAELEKLGSGAYLISHFETCPSASSHSRRKKS